MIKYEKKSLPRLYPIKNLKLCLLLLISFFMLAQSNSEDNEKLEIVLESDLIQLFKEEKYVIALLSDDETCSARCRIFEMSLLSIREDLVEHTGGWVVKSHAPELSKSYGLINTSLLFMREGKPLLYTGDPSDDDMLLNILVNNKISTVHNLTDATFEHETQAGSGATTGDWLIMFTKDDCPECVKHTLSIETVAVNLKGKKNVAFIERNTGAVCARRFGVKVFPAFILFRHGRLYRYITPVTTIGALTTFAEDSFRNSKSESVPQPKSPFDDVTEAAADWLKENPLTFLMFVGAVLGAVAILVLLNKPPPESWTKKSKKKKK